VWKYESAALRAVPSGEGSGTVTFLHADFGRLSS
jgi:hypothetical protein